jgi:hypothetical protein
MSFSFDDVLYFRREMIDGKLPRSQASSKIAMQNAATEIVAKSRRVVPCSINIPFAAIAAVAMPVIQVHQSFISLADSSAASYSTESL